MRKFHVNLVKYGVDCSGVDCNGVDDNGCSSLCESYGGSLV